MSPEFALMPVCDLNGKILLAQNFQFWLSSLLHHSNHWKITTIPIVNMQSAAHNDLQLTQGTWTCLPWMEWFDIRDGLTWARNLRVSEDKTKIAYIQLLYWCSIQPDWWKWQSPEFSYWFSCCLPWKYFAPVLISTERQSKMWRYRSVVLETQELHCWKNSR